MMKKTQRVKYQGIAMVALLLVFSIVLVGQVIGSELTASQLVVMREAADAYLSSGKPANITAQDLFALLSDDDPANNPFILSVRSPDQYVKGHIPGAINIPWRDTAKKENLAKLPKDRQIVVYCYTGHTASQVTALLNVLGYDAVNLKFGMTSWTRDVEVAPSRYQEVKDAKDYPYVTGSEPGR